MNLSMSETLGGVPSCNGAIPEPSESSLIRISLVLLGALEVFKLGARTPSNQHRRARGAPFEDEAGLDEAELRDVELSHTSARGGLAARRQQRRTPAARFRSRGGAGYFGREDTTGGEDEEDCCHG